MKTAADQQTPPPGGHRSTLPPEPTIPIVPGQVPAFTLIELAVILATLALLAIMVLPAMARTGLNSKAFQCLNNNRQLCAAWHIYADDNRDVLVYASQNPPQPVLDMYAWCLGTMDFDPSNQGNWDTNYDMAKRPLWPYSGRNASIYKCPSDLSYVVVGGVAKPRIRSMSMNVFMGGFDGTDGGYPDLHPFRIFLKMTDLTAPGPAATFVFIDERSDTINWGNFATDMNGYPNQPGLYAFNGDLPGLLHDLACSVSFADGHAEIHRWLDPRTTPPLQLEYINSATFAVPNSPDVAWLQAHASSPK